MSLNLPYLSSKQARYPKAESARWTTLTLDVLSKKSLERETATEPKSAVTRRKLAASGHFCDLNLLI